MMDIESQVYGQNRYRTTKAEIVEYYQQTYGKHWKQQLVHALSPIAGVKPKNLERRFDPSRRNNPEKKNASQYRELGEMLPPMPVKAYRIEGVVHIAYSETCVARKINITITGNDAKTFQTMPDIQGIINIYNGFAYDNTKYDSCDEPDVTVTPIY